MNAGSGRATPPRKRVAYLVVAISAVVLGTFGFCVTALTLVPQVRAANGYGITGTITLTEPTSCSRYEPPKQRCGWFGDFRSDDGKVVMEHAELSGGLPPGAEVGDTIAARDAGYPSAVYRADDRDTWQDTVITMMAFGAACLVGVVLLQPWARRALL